MLFKRQLRCARCGLVSMVNIDAEDAECHECGHKQFHVVRAET